MEGFQNVFEVSLFRVALAGGIYNIRSEQFSIDNSFSSFV